MSAMWAKFWGKSSAHLTIAESHHAFLGPETTACNQTMFYVGPNEMTQKNAFAPQQSLPKCKTCLKIEARQDGAK
jgi:hypothetical protein